MGSIALGIVVKKIELMSQQGMQVIKLRYARWHPPMMENPQVDLMTQLTVSI